MCELGRFDPSRDQPAVVDDVDDEQLTVDRIAGCAAGKIEGAAAVTYG